MKTLKIFLVLAAVIISGFTKDSQGIEKGVTVPIRFDGMILTDPSAKITCDDGIIQHASTGWLQGQQSHGGRLITEQSTWVISGCNTDFSTMMNTAYIAGVNTVANGDTYTFTCTMNVNLATGELILHVTFTGGTGRFAGVTGYATYTGVHSPSGNHPVSGWGFLNFPE